MKLQNRCWSQSGGKKTDVKKEMPYRCLVKKQINRYTAERLAGKLFQMLGEAYENQCRVKSEDCLRVASGGGTRIAAECVG